MRLTFNDKYRNIEGNVTMSNEAEKSSIKDWLIAIGVSLLVFYLMDQGIMAIQGLPLNLNMTPLQ